MAFSKSSKALNFFVIAFCLGLSFGLLFWLYHKPASVSSLTTNRLQGQAKPRGIIAIIIDDWGYNNQHCRTLQQIPIPLDIAILPNLPYSKTMAKCAYEAGKEVMLHLPLEPHHLKDKYPKGYIITTTMSGPTVQKTFQKAIHSFPHVIGINNHMGSKATEDTTLMRLLFRLIQEKGLFFIDSRASKKTVCPQVAQEIGIPFAQRDIFLDNVNTPEYIRSQLHLLVKKSAEKGFAIGIGHERPLTLQVIFEETPKLEKEGFLFVTVSKLIRLKGATSQ